MSKIVPEQEPIRVLHVDDDPAFGDLVSTYLEKLEDDIVVVTETRARDGLDRLRDESIDCVVSDYQMHELDGLEFLSAVRETYPNLPFVLFTGRGSEEVASEAINAGVTAYLQKSGSESYELLANQVENAVSRRRSEHRAEIARSRLLELYEQTDGFYTIDADWTVTYWNQQIAARTGCQPEAVVGEEFWEVFPEATETVVHDRFHEAMETREPVEFEVEYAPHGYWAEVRIYPTDDGLFVHSRDVTEKKERERELAQRDQVLKSFANTVSHDLRNPLNVAEGKLELAQETGDLEYLEGVSQAHNRMRNLIDELLRVARGEEVPRSTVSLEQSAERAWETVASEEMTLLVEDDATFDARESQLRRLFENLYWNALEHGTATTVRVGVLDDRGGLYVADDGDGIAPAAQGEVFGAGYSTVEDNPGYGLTIVERIADAHGWEVAVTEGRDGGARFEIRGIDLGDQ